MSLMLWVDARPDAHADDKISTIDRQRFLKRLNDARSRRPYSFATPRVLENHGKFVPAQPGGETKPQGCLLTTSREAHENAIAKGTAHAHASVALGQLRCRTDQPADRQYDTHRSSDDDIC